MRYEIQHGPAYALLKVYLEEGESVVAEPGAMVLMRNVDMKTTMPGGFFKSIMRAALGGESLFVNTFVGKSGGGEVWLAPNVPGDTAYVPLNGEKILIQDNSYLAHHGDVNVGVEFRGLGGFLSEGDFVWLKAEGEGGVWINSFGAMETVELKEGETVTVDNFHLVAMDSGVRYKMRKVGGLKSVLFGGEGIVVELSGPGRVVIQTRTVDGLAQTVIPFLPKGEES